MTDNRQKYFGAKTFKTGLPRKEEQLVFETSKSVHLLYNRKINKNK